MTDSYCSEPHSHIEPATVPLQYRKKPLSYTIENPSCCPGSGAGIEKVVLATGKMVYLV
jgi:hypothetical protein